MVSCNFEANTAHESRQHAKLINITRINVGGKRWIIALLDLFAKGVKVHFIPVEWTLQRGHFVEEAAQGPDVGFEVVTDFVDSLGRHVVRGADEGVGGGGFGREETTESQVAQLDDPLSRDEHVGRFDITMHDTSKWK